jgi:magnesium-protoporphyrin IX monomethyl ester (oxidative) cyclase
MRVTLINPPWYFPKELEFLSQNLGLAYLAAALERYGHRVTMIDAVAEAPERWVEVKAKYETVRRYGLSYEEICARIPKDTGLIGITVPFSHSRRIYEELATEVKEWFPYVPLVAGGVHPSTQLEEAMKAPVDGIVVGEGEGAIVDLAEGVAWEEIPALVYRKGTRVPSSRGFPAAEPSENRGDLEETDALTRAEGGGGKISAHPQNPDARIQTDLVRNPPRQPVRDLDSLPFPARHLLPMDRYLTRSPRGLEDFRTASVITSRGCPFDCGFCSVHPVFGRGYRKHSPERVLEEIVHLVETYDIDHIEFEDDNLTLDPDRAGKILRGLIEIRKTVKPVTWEDPNGIRIDTLNPEFIGLAKDSGCRCLFLALEHGDGEMRSIMRKRLDDEAVENAVRWAAEAGMPVMLFFIVGYPGESLDRYERGVEFCRKLRSLGAGRFEVFIAKPYPGTELLEICRKNEYLRYPDVENLVFTMDTVAVETPDFDAAEVLRRRSHALRVLNPVVYRLKGPLLRLFPRRWLRRARRNLGIQ